MLNNIMYLMIKSIYRIVFCWEFYFDIRNAISSDLKFEWKCTSVDHPDYLLIDGESIKMIGGLLWDSRIRLWDNIILK